MPPAARRAVTKRSSSPSWSASVPKRPSDRETHHTPSSTSTPARPTDTYRPPRPAVRIDDSDDEFSDDGIDWDLCAEQLTPQVLAQQRYAAPLCFAHPAPDFPAPAHAPPSEQRPLIRSGPLTARRGTPAVDTSTPHVASSTSTPSPVSEPAPAVQGHTFPSRVLPTLASGSEAGRRIEDSPPRPRKCTCKCSCGAREYNQAMGFEPASTPVTPVLAEKSSRLPTPSGDSLKAGRVPASPRCRGESAWYTQDCTSTSRRPAPAPANADELVSPSAPPGLDGEEQPHCETTVLLAQRMSSVPDDAKESGCAITPPRPPGNEETPPGDSLLTSEPPVPTPDDADLPAVSASAPDRDERSHLPKPEPDDAEESGHTTAPPALRAEENPRLSPQQQEILDMIVHGGQSLLFTGGAGTGKSVLVRAVVRELRKKYEKWGYAGKAVAVCAMTGVAALHIGGQTLHSWAGVGLGNLPVERPSESRGRDCLHSIVSRNKSARKSWTLAQVLVVDEVSMLDAVLFDKLEHLARLMRFSDAPFGGIQLVLVGDFFQLPPVVKSPTFFGPKDQAMALKLDYQKLCATYVSRFVFDAKSWAQCVPQVVVLRHVFRQSDSEFVRMLEEARHGHLSRHSIQKFHRLARPLDTSDGIEPTELFPLREQVERANLSRLKALKGESHFFQAKDESYVHRKRKNQSDADFKEQVKVYLDRYVNAVPHLELKVGAQVMLLKNLSNGLVNGSLGVVEDFKVLSKKSVAFTDRGTAIFVDPSGIPTEAKPPLGPTVQGEVHSAKTYHHGDVLLAGDSGRIVGAVPTCPSDKDPESTMEGESLQQGDPPADAGDRDPKLEELNETQPAPSVSSQCPSDDQCLARIDTQGSPELLERKFPVEIAVASVSRKGMHSIDTVGPSLEYIEDGKAYPLVRFSSGKKVILPCLGFEVQSPVGDKEALRVQVPLMLAWSMSIHKAQGQTLEKSRVDFTRMFERGQAYVALSRATSLEGLQVLGFDHGSIRAHDRVLEWEKTFLAPLSTQLDADAEADENVILTSDEE